MPQSNAPPSTQVTIDYTNHRGVRGCRDIVPIYLWWGLSAFHNPSGPSEWFCRAIDPVKHATRDFRMKDIHRWGADQENPHA